MIAGALQATARRSHPSDHSLIERLLGRSNTGCGIHVTGDTALESTGVWACNRVISNAFAMLPCRLYRRDAQDSRRKHLAMEHPLYHIMHSQPNPEETAFEQRRFMQGQINIYGNAYAEVERDRAGRVKNIWKLDASRTEKHRSNAGPYYVQNLELGGTKTFRNEEILHLPGIGTDGLLGLRPIHTGREAIGQGLAIQRYQSNFFTQGAVPGGIIERPAGADWEDGDRKNFLDSLRQKASGVDNAHRYLVLEDGMTWKQAGVNPKDAQLIEGRKYNLADLSRIWGVPLPMLGELSDAHFANLEALQIAFYSEGLASILKLWEQRLNMTLLTEEERKVYFFEFTIEGLLRGNMAARSQFYTVALQNGWMTRNEIRAMENKEPLPGGDELLIPLNMAPATLPPAVRNTGALGEGYAQRDAGDRGYSNPAQYTRAKRSVDSRRRVRNHWRKVIAEAAGRTVRAEVRELRSIIAKTLGQRDAADAIAAVSKFYAEQFPDIFDRTIRPVLEAFAAAMADAAAASLEQDAPDLTNDLREYLDGFLARYADFHQNQINKLAEEGADIEERLADWEETEADKTANWESVRLGEYIAVAAFAALGIERMVWVANGDGCPLCKDFDGKIVSVKGSFAEPGDTVDPGGVTPLKVDKKFKHPPLHNGCSCSVGPV